MGLGGGGGGEGEEGGVGQCETSKAGEDDAKQPSQREKRERGHCFSLFFRGNLIN